MHLQQPSLKHLSRSILTIALPISLQNMAFYLQSFINTAFIGHYRIDGLSAINNAMIPFFMFFSFFVALSQGTTVFIAQALGANDQRKAARIAESSLFHNQLISFVYVAFWIVAGPKVLALMGTGGDILAMGGSYIRVMALVYCTVGMNMTAAAIYQGAGNTIPIMVTTFLRVVLNIILDYLLIFGNHGFPRLGVTGAAYATVISVTVSNLALFAALLRSGILPIRVGGIFRPVKGIYIHVLGFGLQTGAEFLLWSCAQVAMLRMLNVFDQLGAGLYGILNTLLNLSVNLYLGIGIAATTLVGQATGATDHRGAFRTGNICALWSLVLCTIVGTVYWGIPERIMHIFTSDRAVIASLASLLGIVALVSFPKAINIVIGNAIRGTGDPRWMLITQSIGTVLIILFAAYLLFVRRLGVAALVWANLGDELWRAVINYGRFYYRGLKHR
ncbi:MAG: MATE family efflux transporter [Chitinispirillaceae bacterium]|nr:MATE family efflux transporter [Chitinispirillaceae bacterium]